MSESPIVEVQLKPTENRLRLEWGLPVVDGKWRYPHEQLQVRVYITPFPELEPPKLLDLDLSERERSTGGSVSAGVFNFGGSLERSTTEKGVQYGPVSADELGRYYPVMLNIGWVKPAANSAVGYAALEWTVNSDWFSKPFTCWTVFGYEKGVAFVEVLRSAEHIHNLSTPDPICVEDPDTAPYVFISYARPQQAQAAALEKFLNDCGLRTFRDVTDIPSAANWDMKIEEALRNTDRMVLLLSAASMPYRKEVHREWFYFDQNQKPIHPLYVEKCDLNSRLYSYNYIDARDDLFTSALERLVRDLLQPWEPVGAAAPRDRIMVVEDADERTMPEAFADLLTAVTDDSKDVALTPDIVKQLIEHRPQHLQEYRLSRIAEWSQPRYQLDNRFVYLSLLIDQGEDAQGQRFIAPQEARRYTDLREILAERDERALVLLGAPGSGKSTLLRRLQLDHEIDCLRDEGERVSFFIQLNEYKPRGIGVALEAPLDWLKRRWRERNPDLPAFDELLKQGRLLLLLDAINEMPHKSPADYRERIELWKLFLRESIADNPGNRVLFSCRSLDYSAPLSSDSLRVPQIRIEALSPEKVQEFLSVYIPARADEIFADLHDSPQFDLFRNPFFLKLLIDQVDDDGQIPQGRAALFTGFVRQALRREIERENRLFSPDTLLTEREYGRIVRRDWRSPHELPRRGVLIPKISDLAYQMQENRVGSENFEVRVDIDDACDMLDHDRDEDIIKAGVALNTLDEDRDELKFFHQLLQEYFAARYLATNPDPALIQVHWHVDDVKPTLDEVLATLGDSDPLPPLPATGWEETTILATAMVKDPDSTIRTLMPLNLPLAARCASNPEVQISAELKADLQQKLIDRSQHPDADLRARITAGLTLGELGDPRFVRQTGPHGDYLRPPLITIPAGEYPMGLDNAPYDREEPAHTVTLATFAIGQFPVTNAEYALFMDEGGYEDEQWWDTDDAQAWLRGEGSTEGQKQNMRDLWRNLQSWTDEQIQGLVQQNRLTGEQAEEMIDLRSWSQERLEDWLTETYPEGKIYRQPGYWTDDNFNNPAQPVVGITWFEARAYCNWLSAQTGDAFRLPTEAEFEAAARGVAGRQYPYGDAFDVARSNTFERHIRRTTPVGIFTNATPEGVYDLTGNAYTWTSSIYDEEQFPYPYQADDGRENMRSNARRILRGGSWFFNRVFARSAYRSFYNPGSRDHYFGFRVVCVRPPSLKT